MNLVGRIMASRIPSELNRPKSAAQTNFTGTNSIGNTAFMIIGIPLGMALSLGIALLLNLEIRGVAVWRTFFYLPSIVPAVASRTTVAVDLMSSIFFGFGFTRSS